MSPCLDYLSEDLKFAKWDYEQMWAAKEIGGWVVNPSEGESTLSKEPGLGNVVLSYLQRFDPDQAARVMDEMWDANALVARQTDTNGISYFITHSHRTYGDRDFAVNATFLRRRRIAMPTDVTPMWSTMPMRQSAS